MHGMWRDGNHFQLLPEAARFLPAMFEAVDGARHSILIELYLMESGRLATALIEVLQRAVERGVTVLLLLDGYGAMGLEAADRRRLEAGGVALRWFNPLGLHSLARNLTRDHRKLVVVDGKVAFTGGFGVVDEFLDAWYEVAMRIEGPVVSDWTRLFCALWDSPMTRGAGAPELVRGLDVSTASDDGYGGMRGRVVWGQGYRYQAIRHSLQRQVSGARRRIWICTPYFVPTLSLRLRLARAARRGVEVCLLLPGESHDHPGVRYAGQRFYGRLLRAGVRIFEFQPSFIHAKFTLADDWVSLGSCNFDHWSLQWNLEANQEVEDARFAEEVAALFRRNFAASHEIHHAMWLRRPRWQRLKEWLFGTLDGLLTRLR
ncbi:phospholipase D-like domain-containing protein [Halomonas stenophila]|uniref:Phosphatidylserine/phosphatidylglycerophosphate/ cardiolipin synthase-like enzyme n=1 Tax=Halomonas stenophila TaxID=795312 RepID=A0A7W5HKA6_9GAMM|nr:phosphatidylserine/phosphatidylglycerophosphate/cardiolipin synthase family protein [Halomonas stenophila]MBB3230262.1 phosphatidylserine/phosphatidylglycerophosphate/cardiolipin synthase-like enzyme [Halomonas stenophila]